MNIAFIIHNQVETGPYWKVLEQCAAYAQLGHTVTLFATSPTARFRPHITLRDGVQVVEAPDMLWGRLRQGVDIWNACIRCRIVHTMHRLQPFDIVHAVDCRPTVIIPSLYMQRFLHVPLVLSWWDLFGNGSMRFGRAFALTFGLVEGWFETYFRRYADAATPITSFLARRLEHLGYPKDRIEVHHLGVDTTQEPLDYDTARSWLYHTCGISQEEKVLCFAGTIYEADFQLLLRALDIVQQHSIPYKIVWIGRHVIDDSICQRYHIYRVGVVPTMHEVYRYFAAADACILPMEVNDANAARWHSKMTDYLNAGAPVALTPVSDFPTYFSAYDIGWLARSSTPEDFAAVLLEALHTTPERRKQLGRNARAFVRQELDVKTIALRALHLYERCIHSYQNTALTHTSHSSP